MLTLSTVIMAAGKGKRMASDLPKVLHPVSEKPMIHYVIDVAETLASEKIVLIVGHQHERVREATASRNVAYALQSPQLGTGHAVLQAQPFFENYEGDILVLSGDVPLLRAETLRHLIQIHHQDKSLATLLTTFVENPTGYGRVLRDKDGFVKEIIEEKDASDAIRNIREINVGIYLFQAKTLFETLPRLKNDNKQGEYYLPDVLKIYANNQEKISAVMTKDVDETHGINTVEHLKNAEAILLNRLQSACR